MQRENNEGGSVNATFLGMPWFGLVPAGELAEWRREPVVAAYMAAQLAAASSPMDSAARESLRSATVRLSSLLRANQSGQFPSAGADLPAAGSEP